MKKMPVLFVGHGSPMYSIEENPFHSEWSRIAEAIPRPKSIVCVSAHWYCEGQAVCISNPPRTIHDFYGFPQELYKIQYTAPGAPKLANRILSLFNGEVSLDAQWGLDHGTWSVLRFMYPEADIPVCQLSVNALLTVEQSYQAGRLLRPLRDEGILIVGSGNIVHNLGLVDWKKEDGFSWANEFDAYIKDAVLTQDIGKIMTYQEIESAQQAFTSRDHFDPFLYALGASERDDQIKVFNDVRVMGSLSMTSYLFEQVTQK